MFEHFSIRRRVSDLEEALETLQRKHSAMQLEWQNTLDKLNQIVGRINKRAALSQEKEDALMGNTVEDAARQRPLFPSLSPRQQEIQNRILARRSQNGGE